MEPSCGSVQANAKRVHWNLEETHASSNGQSISVRKRKERPKTTSNFHGQQFPTIFLVLAYCKHTQQIGLLGILRKYPVQVKGLPLLSLLHPEGKGNMSNLDTYHPQKERIY
jgi:hypothetical protein